MEKLAKAIKMAAKLHEDSYDIKASRKAESSNSSVDYTNFYKKTLEEASDEAAGAVGFDKRGTTPIYLLLKYCWNDILGWAESKF